jgi:hypothetical protein
LANGLLNAASTAPLDVLVFEKDTNQYLSERGGYQIRVRLSEVLPASSPSQAVSKLTRDGISGLEECLDDVTYTELKSRYGAGKRF